MSGKRIPLSVPSIEGNEWQYVKECLDTGWVSSVGSFVDTFEKNFASVVGIPHAVACVNGTAAIHIALQLVGVKADDEILVPTLTFIAPINAVLYCNAKPIFFDADEFYNIDCTKVISFLKNETEIKNGSSYNKKTGARIGAFLPVHVFGNALFFDEVIEECKKRFIPVVEDATESLGTTYQQGKYSGQHTGSVGKVGCFSFNGNKIITTGGGGMLVTHDEALHAKARYLTTQAKDDGKRFVHHEVGYNYRLTNVAAAIGVAQLEKLPSYLAIKKRLFARYQEGFSSVPGLSVPSSPPYAANNHWMIPLQIDKKAYGLDREGLMKALEDVGIETRPVWHLNHLQRPFTSFQTYEISKASQLLDNTLNVPCSVSLSEADQDFVIKTIKDLAKK